MSFDFLKQVPALLADQERRTREAPREAMVCLGPGRHPDQKKRIAALVARLDEMGFSSSSGYDNAVLAALIREGKPALEALLECSEKDRRLTRLAIGHSRLNFGSGGLEVRQVAAQAIESILSETYIEGGSNTNGLSLRDRVKKAQWLPPVERWFKVLADDKATPVDWFLATTTLLSSGEPQANFEPMVCWQANFRPRGCCWAYGVPGFNSPSPMPFRSQDGLKPKLLGEALRARKDPSLTDLILKRIKKIDEQDKTEKEVRNIPTPGGISLQTQMALALAAWEPKAALKSLAEQMPRMREKKDWPGYLQALEVRCQLGDSRALDDYLTFIRKATPDKIDDRSEGFNPAWFQPMADHPDHPGMAAAAEKLFGQEKSPWLPLIRQDPDQPQVTCLIEKLPIALVRQPAYRKAVLRELARREVLLTLDDGETQDLRACDFCVNALSQQLSGVLPINFDGTQLKCDKAVAACVELLRSHQYELFWQSESFHLDKPVTAVQVDKGQAVFTLAGQGTVRVVPGLKLPLPALWTRVKDRPPFKRRFRIASPEEDQPQGGMVVQAEEVSKDGRWQRYYGFVAPGCIARVPAQEIEFSPNPGQTGGDWVRPGPGFHARLDIPASTTEASDNLPPRYPADTALTFAVVVRNSSGLEQVLPPLEKSVRLRFFYSPEVISRQGYLMPRATRPDQREELTPRPGATFRPVKSKVLAPTEEMKAGEVNLREWFDPRKPGFYRLQLVPVVPDRGPGGEGVSEFTFSLAPPREIAHSSK